MRGAGRGLVESGEVNRPRYWPRLPHLLWNIFCAVSLLIFAGSVAVWVRSYFVRDYIIWRGVLKEPSSEPMRTRNLEYLLYWTRGVIQLERRRFEYLESHNEHSAWTHGEEPPVPWSFTPGSPTAPINVHFGSFQFRYDRQPYVNSWFSGQLLACPLWLFLPFAAPPLLWWRRRRRESARGFPVETLVEKKG